MVGHTSIVSPSVLLHMQLFDEGDQLGSARNSLNDNFEAFVESELEQYWSALKLTVRKV
jgi:hypothetical protein